MPFASLDALRAACLDLPAGDESAGVSARERQNSLTKPQGSLGRLEEVAIWLARWQGKPRPVLDRVRVIVFAGSHGITARGVSAFPAEVTAQMVANFAGGGAAINQLANAVGASLRVVPLEVERPTVDFTQEPAMSEAEFLEAVSAGHDAVEPGTDLLCLGEMGIGNTTVAAAVAAGLFGGDGASWVGRGTGVDDAGLDRKAKAVDLGLARHADALSDPLEVLRRLGGRELAAMFGAALAARRQNTPLLLDGFVCSAAVGPLVALRADGLDHALAGHASAEAGHRRLLDRLGLDPLLDLGMRLGEASGACTAVAVVRAAVACHNGMASFAEAGVSGG
ncbi:MAG: nicotinate-nucleotide--dimethylbenzimidazole phosphoribosyltransferase [Mesorhizobium amorphae]|nr:MAG: nicotinate-nucleotide--dimethylbenzimidazole phosphoribosyltransferase [Mesorhizobium amorphae]